MWLRGDRLVAVLMLLPSIIAVAVFIYGFIAWTGYVSTVKWNTVVEDYTPVGLANWIKLFKMERFHWDMRNLLFYAAAFMSQCIVIGFFVAFLLDQRIKAESLFRTIVVFPFAVSAVVTGVAWRWLMQPTTGINLLLRNLGIIDTQFAWNADPKLGIFAISIAAAWQFTGSVSYTHLEPTRPY